MFLDLEKLEKNAPKELKEDIEEIISLSRKFRFYSCIPPNQYLEQIKLHMQEALNHLLKILNKLYTMIINLYIQDKTTQELSYQMIFQENIANIISNLKEKQTEQKNEAYLTISFFLRFSGELITTYDFLIFQPITEANRKYENLNEWVRKLYTIIQVNASFLGISPQIMKSAQKQFIPLSTLLLSQLKKELKEEKEEKEIEKSEANPTEEQDEVEE